MERFGRAPPDRKEAELEVRSKAAEVAEKFARLEALERRIEQLPPADRHDSLRERLSALADLSGQEFESGYQALENALRPDIIR